MFSPLHFYSVNCILKTVVYTYNKLKQIHLIWQNHFFYLCNKRIVFSYLSAFTLTLKYLSKQATAFAMQLQSRDMT